MWLVFALFGALGKSYSSFFRKKLAHKVSVPMFLWFTSSVILLMLMPIMLFRLDEAMSAFINAPIALLGASATYIVATYLNLEALRREELSYIAPLGAFVPIFTLVIAALFLGETPPLFGILGVGVIFAGAYIISLKPEQIRWYDPLKHLLTNSGARFSIGVALFYAINSVFFKQASNLGYDTYTILFCTTLVYWIVFLAVPLTKRKEFRKMISDSKVALTGAGVSNFAGSFFHILAIAGTFASYAVSIRRFDSVISVLLGWKYLKETNIRNKLIGSVIMSLGAIVIAVAN